MAVASMTNNMAMNYMPPSYPIPNQHMMDFDAFSTGQTTYEDSESESNFTSDEFDSEYADDVVQHEPYMHYNTPQIEPEPNTAHQLLDFAEMVNKDIQKYFGKRKAIDDADHDTDDVCKDRFASGKSGRELYYADLLKVARGSDANIDSNPEPRKKQPERIIISNKDGYWDNKLGPLGELFEYAGSRSTVPVMQQTNNWTDYHHHTDKHRTCIPWRKRSLPRSFFLEPHTSHNQHAEQRNRQGLPQDPPDFSDLMAAAADD